MKFTLLFKQFDEISKVPRQNFRYKISGTLQVDVLADIPRQTAQSQADVSFCCNFGYNFRILSLYIYATFEYYIFIDIYHHIDDVILRVIHCACSFTPTCHWIEVMYSLFFDTYTHASDQFALPVLIGKTIHLRVYSLHWKCCQSTDIYSLTTKYVPTSMLLWWEKSI